MSDLIDLEARVLEAFQQSGVDQWGGPGGALAMVGDELWRIGYGPGETYFAGVSPEAGPVRRYVSYSLNPRTPHEGVRRFEEADYANHGFRVNLDSFTRVEDLNELEWVIKLLEAVRQAGQHRSARVAPFTRR